MPRIQITFTDEQVKVIQREADKRKASFAAIIREAVEEWAERRNIVLTEEVSWGGLRPAQDETEQESGEIVAVAVG